MHRTLSLLLLLSGCTVTEPTLTHAQALNRVEALIQETAEALTPKPRLEPLATSSAPSDCLDESQPEDQIVVSRAYWLRDLPKNASMTISQQVRAHWQAKGHRIVASGGPGLNAESRPDHFRLALVWADEDSLYIGVSSTCASPEPH